MQPAQVFSPNATTFLTHLVGGGLADKRYVVQSFKSMLDGDIRPVEVEAPKGSRRRTAKRVLATLKEVKEMRPGRNEIIVCTGLNLRDCGVQYWGLSRREFSTTASSAAHGARPGRPAGHPSPTRGGGALAGRPSLAFQHRQGGYPDDRAGH